MCFVSVTLLPLFLWMMGGPVSQSFSAFGFLRQGGWKRPPSRPLTDSALGGSWWASLSVSLDCALICYNLVELDSPESVM